MSRFRFLYGSHDFGWQRHVCIDGPQRQCTRFVLNPKRGQRRSYMRLKLLAQRTLREWMQNTRLRTRSRIKARRGFAKVLPKYCQSGRDGGI